MKQKFLVVDDHESVLGGTVGVLQQQYPDAEILTSLTAQLTPDSLLSLEQIGIGGINTVRGYRQNQLVTDNGILGSIEVRIPLTSDPSLLQLTPFF